MKEDNSASQCLMIILTVNVIGKPIFGMQSYILTCKPTVKRLANSMQRFHMKNVEKGLRAFVKLTNQTPEKTTAVVEG